MSDMEWFTTWIAGGILLFTVWVLIPERAQKDYDKAAQIPNPIVRQGILFFTLVTWLLAGVAVVGVAALAMFNPATTGFINDNPTIPKWAWWAVGAAGALILIFGGKRKRQVNITCPPKNQSVTGPQLGKSLWRCRHCGVINTALVTKCSDCGARRPLRTM